MHAVFILLSNRPKVKVLTHLTHWTADRSLALALNSNESVLITDVVHGPFLNCEFRSLCQFADTKIFAHKCIKMAGNLH